jgi:hypothetical protein
MLFQEEVLFRNTGEKRRCLPCYGWTQANGGMEERPLENVERQRQRKESKGQGCKNPNCLQPDDGVVKWLGIVSSGGAKRAMNGPREMMVWTERPRP